MIKFIVIAILIALFVTIPLLAEEKQSINDLSFMTGKWVGEGFGGRMEEIWSEPFGLTMVATFRLVINDTAKVLEYTVVEESGAGLTLRFKHYNQMMKPWEDEPLTYEVKESNDHKAVFVMPKYKKDVPKELVYDRSGDTMKVILVGWPEENGTIDTIPLTFTKEVF